MSTRSKQGDRLRAQPLHSRVWALLGGDGLLFNFGGLCRKISHFGVLFKENWGLGRCPAKKKWGLWLTKRDASITHRE
jgi:hypothetical protein